LTPDQYCQEKAANSGSSFYYSFLFLPAEKRRAIMALYAFCREVDDIVDECSDPFVAKAKLGWWRSEIENVFSGKPEHPVGHALQPVVLEHNLPIELFNEIMDGMEMDLTVARYPDFKSLQLYCYRVASAVGLLSAEIFGFTDRKTLDYAHDLGIALQLTNIIRDVGEDARRNRIYIPMDEMAEYGVSASSILNAQGSENFEKLMAFQIDRAKSYYAKAMGALPEKDRKNQRPGLVMAAIYSALLDEIAKDPSSILKCRTSLTPVRKIWIAWKTWRRA
jgi:phytoene synthase